jgi:hypothetical protein
MMKRHAVATRTPEAFAAEGAFWDLLVHLNIEF